MTYGFAFFNFIVHLFVISSSQSATLYGPAICESIFEDLRTTFILTNQIKSYNIEYEVVPGNEVGSYLTLGQPVIVDTLQAISNDSISLPLFGFPLVIVFNLNASTLSLSQNALVDIFVGRITHWNDPNLTSINPDVTLPDEPIQLVAGPLLDRFTEAISVLAGEPVNVDNRTNTISGDLDVGARVKAVPYSLGFSWMANALATSAKLALLQNKDGFFVTPNDGAASALVEFTAVWKKLKLPYTLPHNMAGRFSWPLMGILYAGIPRTVASCEELEILQHFLSFVMFQTDNMDLMVELLGWQAAERLLATDGTLGIVPDELDTREKLYGIECGVKDENFDVLVGTTPELELNLLKLIVPYAANEDSAFHLATFTKNITTLLDAMVLQGRAAVEVDAILAWEPVLAPYPQLPTVDVFMGSMVVVVNIADAPPILSLPVVADIFLRVITHWNDPRIVALNPGVKLPNASINILAAPIVPHGRTDLFVQLLSQSSLNFSWDRVEKTIPRESDVRDRISFVPNSIGYGFGHLLEHKLIPLVSRIIGFGDAPVAFSADSLSACWISREHKNCWPLAMPLSFALRRPIAGSISCIRQKRSVDFVWWVSKSIIGLNPFLVPNLIDNNLGEAEFCEGRSLVMTRPEPRNLDRGLQAMIRTLAAIALIWALCQAIALGIARKRSELKSASVIFSVTANIGVYFILWAPFMLIADNPSALDCGASIWFVSLGFSLCYGSLFVKLFRLYIIFTSRRLVVPRMGNRKLFRMIIAFLVLDFILLVAYTIVSPPHPTLVSSFVRDERDLVTGFREFTLHTCSFDIFSWPMSLIMAMKLVIVFGGAFMAFFIRNVDRRFSATSALGWAFYNMFLTSTVAVLVMLLFDSDTQVPLTLIIPIASGIWGMYVTLLALTLDSNVLLACKDFSKPLRKMLATRDFRAPRKQETNQTSNNSNDSASTEPKQSRSSTFFVVNREMFPSKYDDFAATLLEQVLEELNFQRAAVRRVLALNSTGTTTGVIELTDAGERNRGSTAASPRSNKPTPSSERLSRESSKAGSSQSHLAPTSQISSDIFEAKPILNLRNASDPLLPSIPLQSSPALMLEAEHASSLPPPETIIASNLQPQTVPQIIISAPSTPTPEENA